MAFIQGQQDENDQNGQGQQNQLVSGQGSNAVGAGVSQAGVGAGGSGGWTNIQAYLKANEGNNQSAQAAKNEFGGQFQGEEAKLNEAADKTKADSDNALKSPSVQEAMGGGTAADAMTKYLNQGYQGPRTFDYSISGKTSTAGDALGSREGWQGLMQSLYDKSAGGRMTTGQRSLQQQLDVNNPLLAQTQTDLQGQYGQLKANAASKAQDVGDYLSQADSKLQTGQANTKGEIGQRATNLKSELDALSSGQKPWNEAKYGPLQDYLSSQGQVYDRLMGFLGMGQQAGTAPNATTKDPLAGAAPVGGGQQYIDPLTGQPIKVYA